ncbi:MAG: MATE family efflux transporter [Lachnospiraceae bacterium]|nr:MATE family efflux transporter [Lachnospiraceae bacterium]
MENALFEKVPVPKAYMTLALPVVFSMMVTLIYNMVDTWFIALTGVTELVAGTSLVVPIFTMMIAFGDIFGLGGASLISRLFGEKRDAEAKQTCAFCFWAAIAFGLAVTFMLLLFRTPILTVLGADASTMQHSSGYYTWIAVGAAAIILGLVPSNLLRTEGLAKQAMFGSILGSVANIILDPIFIFVLGQGAAGAAMATVLGNILADCYYAYAVVKYSRRLSISLGDIRLNGHLPGIGMIRSILVIGIPASITNLMQSFMIMMTNKYLLPYGTDKIAAMGIAMKVNMITMLILVGFAFGGQPLIGYNYGARNQKRLKEILRFAYIFMAGAAVVLSAVMCLFAPAIIGFFMQDVSIIEHGALMLRFQQMGMLFMAVTLVSTCVCQSVGNALGAFALSISRQGVIYILVLAAMSTLAGYQGVLVSQAIADLLTAAMALVIIRGFMKKIK